MLNLLALKLLSGFMAINMAAAPVSTRGTGDVVNPRYYGTYETHMPSEGKIIIDSNGCKVEKVFLGNSNINYPYATSTGYAEMFTINISEFYATFSPTQYIYVNAAGEKRTPAKDDPLLLEGTVSERDEQYAPPRRYILVRNFNYWKDL